MKALSRILQALFLASMLAPAGVQAQMNVKQIITIPASPISTQDYVTILAPVHGCRYYFKPNNEAVLASPPTVSITHPTYPTSPSTGRIDITVVESSLICMNEMAEYAWFAVPISVGRLQAATYTINYLKMLDQSGLSLPPEIETSYSLSLDITVGDNVTPANAPLPGLWAITSEVNGSPGRGFQIQVHGQTMVLTFYGYDSSGKGRFWLASGFFNSVAGGNSWFDGTLRTYDGGTTFGGPAKSAQETGNAGAVSLTFTSPTTGTITLPGESAKDISYFQF